MFTQFNANAFETKPAPPCANYLYYCVYGFGHVRFWFFKCFGFIEPGKIDGRYQLLTVMVRVKVPNRIWPRKPKLIYK